MTQAGQACTGRGGGGGGGAAGAAGAVGGGGGRGAWKGRAAAEPLGEPTSSCIDTDTRPQQCHLCPSGWKAQ